MGCHERGDARGVMLRERSGDVHAGEDITPYPSISLRTGCTGGVVKRGLSARARLRRTHALQCGP
jgi:hypothetical protein